MLNLNIEGLQDLEKSELESTNGGILPILAIMVIADLATVAFGIGLYNGYHNAAH